MKTRACPFHAASRLSPAITIVAVAAVVIALPGRVHVLPSLVHAYNLLASSTALWLTNVLACSLLYWALDAGGPDHRLAGNGGYPDFMFA